MIFADRADAGRRLAAQLVAHRGPTTVVAGLARGGIPVAAEVAAALEAPLEVLVVRKIGAPGNPEYGMGAVGEDGHVVTNRTAVQTLGVTEAEFDRLAGDEAREVARRVAKYRGGRPREPFEGRTVVIVDDGLATGVTARAGVDIARRMGAAAVVLAVPVGAPESVRSLREVADEVVCLDEPPEFRAVGNWYADFAQVSDADVISLLAGDATPPRPPAP